MHDSTNLPRDRQKPTVDFTVRTKPTVRLFACPLWQCTVRRKRAQCVARRTSHACNRCALVAAASIHARSAAASSVRCGGSEDTAEQSEPAPHRTALRPQSAQWGGCACACLCATGREPPTAGSGQVRSGQVRSGGGVAGQYCYAFV